jgi:hypothetical protein
VCVTILKVENKKEDDFSMSISSMNLNVANDVYGLNEAKKKAPAGAQPREEAPTTTITPSASDTVTLSTKDDASAQTTAADGLTPVAKPQFPVLPVAIGGGVGAIGGGLVGHWAFGDEPKDGGKVDLDGDNFKVKDKDKFEADGKNTVKDKTTGLIYEIKEHDTNAKIVEITGKQPINSKEFTYVKGDKPSWTHEFTLADDRLEDVLGAKDAKATVHVEDGIIKLVAKDKPTLEWKLGADGTLTQSDSLKAIIKADPTNTTHSDKVIAGVETFLKDTFKPEEIAKGLKDKFTPKKLPDLVELKDAGGFLGKEFNWALPTGAIVLGGLGAAAGWFFGKKKPEPTPEAPPAS